MVHDNPQRFGKSRTRNAQFLPVQNGELVQQLLAVRGEFNQYFATVLITGPAFHCPMFYQAIHKLYSAVMAKAKPVGKSRDGRTSTPRQSLDRKQKLMLLRFDALRSGGFFAEVQELTDAIPEFGELAVTRNRDILAVHFRANILAAESHLNDPLHLNRITIEYDVRRFARSLATNLTVQSERGTKSVEVHNRECEIKGTSQSIHKTAAQYRRMDEAKESTMSVCPLCR
jgi:hypothetical protein